MKLNFFVLFSSIEAVWDAKGPGLYAAANQFLDALGLLLTAQSTQATVARVNWGTFAEIHQAKKRWPFLEKFSSTSIESKHRKHHPA